MNNIGNSKGKKVGGVLIGLLFVIIGIILLWYNEGRTVKTAQVISKAEKEYIDVDSASVDTNNNGKLIATSGTLQIPTVGVSDTRFGIQVQSAKLTRIVEMYQWKESCTENDNGNETCNYQQVWEDKIINSNNFENKNYQNPSEMPYNSQTFLAQNTTVGAYNLDDNLLNQLSTSKRANTYDNETTMNMGLTAINNYYTNVQNNSPQIGDIRISFKYNDATNVSILAVQNNNSFTPFTESSGYNIYELQEGKLTGKEILLNLTSENNSVKWMLRVVGTLLVIIGFTAMISPLQRLANYIPIFGTIFGWISGMATFILGLAISTITIALAWLRYRPVFSICLLATVIVVIALLKKSKLKKQTSNINQAPTPNIVNSQTTENQNFTNIQNMNNPVNNQNIMPNTNNINQPPNANSNNDINQSNNL